MNLFYNPQEHRPRALVRILAQLLLFLAIQGILQVPLSFIIVGILAASGRIPAGLMNDVTALNEYLSRAIPQVGWYQAAFHVMALVAMLLSVYIAARFLDRRPFRALGFHFRPAWWRDLAFGLALGAALMTLIFAIERAAGWVTVTATSWSMNGPFGSSILFALVSYLCVGIYEELFSRGYQVRNLAEGFNFPAIGARAAVWWAYMLSSTVFAFLHFANPSTSWASTANLIAAGLFLGLGYVLTGELGISIGLHITWNFFEGNVFGFPVSGNPTFVSFLATQQSGPDLWTGGAFGPEAGIVALVVLLLGSGLVLLYVRATRGRLAMDEDLAEYQARP